MKHENIARLEEISTRIGDIDNILNLINDLTDKNIVTITIGVKVADLNTANDDYIKMSKISYTNNDAFRKFITEQLQNERKTLIDDERKTLIDELNEL